MANASAVFEATYADWKLIKTRKVVQIVLEVPVEAADHAYQVLGGMPNHAAEAWLAIAKLDKSKPEKQSKRFHEMSVAQQAAMRCGEVAFWEYLEFVNKHLWAKVLEYLPTAPTKEVARVWLHNHFAVQSRKDIDPVKWQKFDSEYLNWCRVSA